MGKSNPKTSHFPSWPPCFSNHEEASLSGPQYRRDLMRDPRLLHRRTLDLGTLAIQIPETCWDPACASRRRSEAAAQRRRRDASRTRPGHTGFPDRHASDQSPASQGVADSPVTHPDVAAHVLRMRTRWMSSLRPKSVDQLGCIGVVSRPLRGFWGGWDGGPNSKASGNHQFCQNASGRCPAPKPTASRPSIGWGPRHKRGTEPSPRCGRVLEAAV